ncbi:MULTISPECIES: ABC transporter permease [Bacillales]|jgi:spermidine/putrescine transport system permease protein|uniref:ABC transporter permease n=1 Tax=Brevibacillus aydinogluensis TaxID=927786 RepID=A0AA48M759_9BACL|nr:MULTISPECIES: ABC transporter permease [Bacillales]MBR8658694.1 ABC transporter permease [Brevibacillus sp. NL20B1]MDT3416014.1 spermidine/putrescine transport system permease protein [Brevibacillus aydinogluensis]UFJ61561.1 ABC transporter permease [Anoxybacillus sediminis]CAJ1001560.1 ABC transporter permease [Brevibacillus aydinogluensis]
MTTKRLKLLALPALVWLGALFVLPLLMIAALSFLKRGTYGQIVYQGTLDNYTRIIDPLYGDIFLDTLAISVLTTFLALVCGYPLAYHISRMRRSAQKIWLLLVMIPFWINFLVRSYAWVIILRSQGVINTVLQSLGLIDEPLPLLYNSGSVLLGMVYTLLPFMVLPIYVSLEQMDRRKLEAAYDLGATPWKAFWHVTLPLSKTGVVTGSILVFVSSIGMFVVPDVMGGAKSALIGNVIQNQFLSARDWPFGSALSIVLMLLSMLLIFLYYRATKAAGPKEGAA